MWQVQISLHRFWRCTRRIFYRVAVVAGIVFMILIGLAFTDWPFMACYRLGTAGTELNGAPDYIVVMGAGGMPGAEGLIRCYYAAEAAEAWPEARVIIALPTLPEYFDESHTRRMYNEMVLRGVDSTRFLFEITGTNTRSQALAIAAITGRPDTCRLLIVTSPEHMYRAVRVFRKAGFGAAGGVPSFGTNIDESLLLTRKEKSGEALSPDRMPGFRYNLWNYLKYEINFIREVIAISWYWLNGWI